MPSEIAPVPLEYMACISMVGRYFPRAKSMPMCFVLQVEQFAFSC